ncbi:MAG: hypothetical protein QM783_09075 [Phycisphaerales bacterium]
MLAAAGLAACSQSAESPTSSGPAVAPSFSGVPSAPPSYAPAENASTPVIRSVADWSFNNDPGKMVTTENFVIYTTERSSIITQRMPAFLEAAIANYRTAVGGGELPAPTRPIDVYVMNDRAQWQTLTLGILGERGKPVVNGIKRGGFTTQGKSLLFDIGSFDTMSIAAHEAWHAYTQTTFAETLPMWAEEGLATFMEGHRWNGAVPQFSGWANVARFDRLRVAAKDNGLMSLEAVLASSPNQMIGMRGAIEQIAGVTGEAGAFADKGATDGPILWYSQVWALIEFLNEGEGGKYRAAFQEMVQDAAAGKMRARVVRFVQDKSREGGGGAHGGGRLLPGAVAVETFRAYFGNDLRNVGQEYERFCKQAVAVGARERVTMGQSPFSK